tara:strand:- start:38 stop:691 length:654 start_codon:yes stop_codon:yes gene_type:complete
MRPKHLAMKLSRLSPHPCREVALEQYATEGDLAAYWLLAIDQLDGIEGKVVADLGAGNGILGIGALLLGAKHVLFVEADEDAMAVLKTNLASLDEKYSSRAELQNASIGRDEIPLNGTDLVVMNPPWGVQKARADRPFLETAFASPADAVHLLHSDGARHLEALANERGWSGEAVLRTEFRLPPTYAHHAQRKGTTDVKCWRFFRGDDRRLETEDPQ